MGLLDEINKVPNFTEIPTKEFFAKRLEEMFKESEEYVPAPIVIQCSTDEELAYWEEVLKGYCKK